MNEQPKHGAPTGATSQPLVASLPSQYEAAWQAVQEGQEVPNLEAFLTSAAESERPELEKKLRLIAADYEQRQPQPTLAQEPGTLIGLETPSAILTEFTMGNPPDQQQPSASLNASTPSAVDGAIGVSHAQTLEYNARDSEAPGGADQLAGTVSFEGGLEHRPPGAVPPLTEGGTHPRPTVAGYEIIGVLGRGGMGVVYKARQIGLNRIVALKMVLAGAHAGQHQLARFQAEAEAVAKLRSPEHRPDLRDRRARGTALFLAGVRARAAAWPRRSPASPARPAKPRSFVEQLARAMHVAHQHGIIHRDLKPANVLLTPERHAQDHRLRPGQGRWRAIQS